jgi:hypothetical protein
MEYIDIDALTAPFPPEALEKREGGSGKFFTYIKTHAVINRLNHACGYQWDFRIIEQHFEAQVLICRGELTIPGLGTRAQVGVQKISPNGGEDLLKGAASDCLKKCATLFGVGIELYGDDVEAEGYVPDRRPATQRPAYNGNDRSPQRPAQNAAPRPQTPANAPSDAGEIKPCYKCGSPVRVAFENGKPERYNSDGSQHFKTCDRGPTGYEADDLEALFPTEREMVSGPGHGGN